MQGSIKQLKTALFIARICVFVVLMSMYALVDASDMYLMFGLFNLNSGYLYVNMQAKKRRLDELLPYSDMALATILLLVIATHPYALFYFFTAFLWVVLHVLQKQSSRAVYALLVSYLLMLVSFVVINHQELTLFWAETMVVTSCVLFFICYLVYTLFSQKKRQERANEELYLFTRALRDVKDTESLYDHMAATVSKLLGQDKKSIAIYCFDETDASRSLEYSYYRNVLAEMRDLATGIITLTSYHGNKETFYCYPFKDDRDRQALILISAPASFLINESQLASLKHATESFNTHRHVLHKLDRTKEEVAWQLRKKHAQDIHDGLAQQLFYLSAQLFNAKVHLKEPADKVWIESAEEQVKQCQVEARSYISSLRDEHKRVNLYEAIEALVARLTQHASFKTELAFTGRPNQENVQSEEVIYRLVEEGINNVIQHASAKNVYLSVECNVLQWTIVIKDDGIGITEFSSNEQSFGLKGMRERINSVDGTVAMHSAEGVGTEIMAIIPRRLERAYG